MSAHAPWNLTPSPAFVMNAMGGNRGRTEVIILRARARVEGIRAFSAAVKFWSIGGKSLTKSMRAYRQGLEGFVVLVVPCVGRLLF